MQWQIVCDFDGTIAQEDVTGALVANFAEDRWKELEADRRTGLIGSRKSMLRQVDLIRDHPFRLDRWISEVTIDPAFPAFMRFCSVKGGLQWH